MNEPQSHGPTNVTDAQSSRLEETARRVRELEIAVRLDAETVRRRSAFVGSMSHALRTPLNAILGFSEILTDGVAGDLDEQQRRECAQQIHLAGRRLLALVNDVTDLSRIEAGPMQLRVEAVGIAAVVHEVEHVTRQDSERGNVSVVEEIDPPGLEILADRRQFKQVVYNLLSNGIRFTPAGGTVTVRARAEGGGVLLAVSDTGVGMTADDLAQAFTEFWQGDTEAARRGEGSGLGLALVWHIVAEHGGTVEAVSAPGEGSTFTVHLPAVQPARQGARARRVLVVDGDRNSREQLIALLRGNGLEADAADGVEQSHHKIRTNDYDLMLMDVQLPGLDTPTLIRMLKSNPRTAHVPVVALSARAMRGDERQALAAGCSGYLSKPINVARFAEEITTYLEAPAR